MMENFTITKGQVSIIIEVHKYNGHHFTGRVHFEGDVSYVQKLRDGLGDSIVRIRDYKPGRS